MASSHPLSIQIRVHHLNENENLESLLFPVKKGCIVQFKLGSTLFGQRIKLFINYPEKPTDIFKRHVYRELKWKSESSNKGDDTALYCDTCFEVSGSFHYFFMPEGGDVLKPSGSGYILVDPVLTYGPENDILSLDSILCVTYLAKHLGPFDEWEARLRTAKEIGYNMIHLTPIQELGGSLSCYSLRNQLKLNPTFDFKGKKCTIDDLSTLVEKMRVEWKVMAITDIVLNHTANESEWLQEHPESTYNLTNSPHLRPAYLFDRAVWYLTLEIADGKWTASGIPPDVNDESHINGIRGVLQGYYKHQLNLHEFYMLDIDEVLKIFRTKLKNSNRKLSNLSGELKIIQDPEFRRFKSTIDYELALSNFAPTKITSDEEVNRCCENLKKHLEQLNSAKKSEIDNHFHAGVENILSAVRYERLNPNGPQIKIVSAKHPLVPCYFLHYGKDSSLKEDEKLMFSPQCCYIMAHNGWVMGHNPLKNFADPDSNVYLRRELVAWGDSVKLRYGEKPEDSPYLWEHMTKYVQQLSGAFHGLRLDNCHSTPIHVAEYLIDKAREVRSDIFIIAELFTSSEGIDNIFVNRLGITALIREAMAAPDSHEQGRLVYRYGGSTVGAFIHPVTRPLTKSIAHAVFMDITHDNECPMQRRSVYDYFPTAAMVSMACCSTGSSWGYDQLVPHHIHVVSETRLYSSWTNDQNPKRGYINEKSGIISGKRALNKLHSELGNSGFSQVFVDQRDEHTVAITRHCPATHQSVIMVARTSFRMPSKPNESSYTKPLRIQGTVDEVILEGKLVPVNHNGTSLGPSFQKDENFINGLTDFELLIKENIPIYESEMIESSGHSDGYTEIDFISFPPGSVIVLRVSLDSDSRAAILKIRSCVSQFGYRMRSYSGNVLKRGTHDFESILSHLSLADLNRVLFRCEAEETDEGKGRGAYNLPGYADLVYCGLQGIMSELMNIHLEDDLGHPLCQNLRDGNWLPDYIVGRLLDHHATHDLGKWFQVVFENLKLIPRYLIPCYFDTVITGAYSSLLTSLWRKMSDFVSEGSTFVKALSLGSVILCGIIRSAPLPLLSPNLIEPLPKEGKDEAGRIIQDCVSISAGLPHFSTGYMRNWGRDTFISLKGLLLVTGRYEDARYIILAFAGCLRHGLIPNLLDRGVCARFNCRDAVWWWLQSIQEYVKIVPDGYKILRDKVSRIFPTDDSEPQPPGKIDQPLHDVIQEALQTHFQGLKFRERNAGPQLDEHMTYNGFNNEIGVDLKTGFVFGGNENNCGTWMDKMGSSDKAGNRGKPATPRDGSAVEIVGLCKSALRWLDEMFQLGHYPYCMVERVSAGDVPGLGKTLIMTFREWSDLIQKNFEKHFYVSTIPTAEDSKLINKRGIYKDCVNATQPWTDFQLRPNFPIAMSVAPELFTPENAWTALNTAEKYLLGPLGMKTLDPTDWAYDGNYDNSNDSTDMKKARGWNYHQGPEWLWPVGYFLRAKLMFSSAFGGKTEFDRTIDFTKRVMSRHFYEIQKSKWRGLPELTNKDGAYCRDSCIVQAWSHATLLDVLYEMDMLCASINGIET